MAYDGEAHFERGCALGNICDFDYNNKSILEYCGVCYGRYCNNEYMKLNDEIEEYLQQKLSSTTEKTTTAVMTTHSQEWYSKKFKNRKAVVQMERIRTPSTTKVYSSPSDTEDFTKPSNEINSTIESATLRNMETNI